MKNTLENLILGNWGGIRLRAEIEEKLEDIDLIIKYNDHGDDFLVIRSNGKYYEYGYWLNRKFQPEYDVIISSQRDYGFIRKPKLFCAFDKNCILANKIYFDMKHRFYETEWMRSDFIRKEYDQSYAQYSFDKFIEYMGEVYDKGIIYHQEDIRRDAEKYLETNGILTQENINKLDEVKWTSRIDEVDGIAGKKECDTYISGDKIEFIFYKGKPLHWRKTKRRYYRDDWGFSIFGMSLDQFK